MVFEISADETFKVLILLGVILYNNFVSSLNLNSHIHLFSAAMQYKQRNLN